MKLVFECLMMVVIELSVCKHLNRHAVSGAALKILQVDDRDKCKRQDEGFGSKCRKRMPS